MIRFRTVAVAFVVVVVVFLITHVGNFPGSVARLMDVTGGQKILDMQASFTADETYARLGAMGELGREMYMRMILTVDLVFPISVFVFLVLWTKAISERMTVSQGCSVVRGLRLLPAIYVALDGLENGVALILLARYPHRLDALAGSIGFLTSGKRAAMLLALSLPLVLWLGIRTLQLVHGRRVAPGQ